MKKQRRRNQQEWCKWDQSSELISFWWVSGPDAVIEPDSLDFILGVVILSKINCWFLLPRSTPDKSHDFRLKHLINWCFTKEELIHVKSSKLQGPEEEERSHPGCFFPPVIDRSESVCPSHSESTANYAFETTISWRGLTLLQVSLYMSCLV